MFTIHLVHNPIADGFDHTPFVKGGDVEVYVTLETERIRRGHVHGFINIDRDGDGVCIDAKCGAAGWSPWWVAADRYADGTRIWVEERESEMRRDYDFEMARLIADSARISAERAAMLERTEHLKPVEAAVISIAAAMTFDEPAEMRRRGIPVPPMARGVVVSIEEMRSRKAARVARRS